MNAFVDVLDKERTRVRVVDQDGRSCYYGAIISRRWLGQTLHLIAVRFDHGGDYFCWPSRVFVDDLTIPVLTQSSILAIKNAK